MLLGVTTHGVDGTTDIFLREEDIEIDKDYYGKGDVIHRVTISNELILWFAKGIQDTIDNGE